MTKLNDNPELLEEIIKQTTDISNMPNIRSLTRPILDRLFPNKRIFYSDIVDDVFDWYNRIIICIEYRREVNKQLMYNILIKRLPKDIVNIIIEYGCYKPIYLLFVEYNFKKYRRDSFEYQLELAYNIGITTLLRTYDFKIITDINDRKQFKFNGDCFFKGKGKRNLMHWLKKKQRNYNNG